jgi:hypothetical protein
MMKAHQTGFGLVLLKLNWGWRRLAGMLYYANEANTL